MVTSPLAPPAARLDPESVRVEHGMRTLGRALRQKREEADALVRLVEQATPSAGKGQHVDYFA